MPGHVAWDKVAIDAVEGMRQQEGAHSWVDHWDVVPLQAHRATSQKSEGLSKSWAFCLKGLRREPQTPKNGNKGTTGHPSPELQSKPPLNLKERSPEKITSGCAV